MQTSPTPTCNLRKQLTFYDNTTSEKWVQKFRTDSLRSSRRLLMTCHYPDLGSASDWLKQSKFPMHHNQSEAIPRSGKQYVISMEFLHMVVSQNVGCFQWRIQGRPKTKLRPKEQKYFFVLDPPPPSWGKGDQAHPYVKVWVCHWFP